MLVAIPAMFIGAWWFLIPLFPQYSAWRSAYAGLFAVTIVGQLLVFLLPMRSFHVLMRTERSRLLREADELSANFIAGWQQVRGGETAPSPDQLSAMAARYRVDRDHADLAGRRADPPPARTEQPAAVHTDRRGGRRRDQRLAGTARQDWLTAPLIGLSCAFQRHFRTCCHPGNLVTAAHCDTCLDHCTSDGANPRAVRWPTRIARRGERTIDLVRSPRHPLW
jgi:hypothetical protein